MTLPRGRAGGRGATFSTIVVVRPRGRAATPRPAMPTPPSNPVASGDGRPTPGQRFKAALAMARLASAACSEPIGRDDPRHLIITLGGATFGLPLHSVLFILGVDRARAQRGELVLAIGGHDLPVVDLRSPRRLGLDGHSPRILVLGPADRPVAALVGTVERVAIIPPEHRRPLPDLAEMPAVAGLAWDGETQMYLLDPDELAPRLARGEGLYAAPGMAGATVARRGAAPDEVNAAAGDPPCPTAPAHLMIFTIAPRQAGGVNALAVPVDRLEQVVSADDLRPAPVVAAWCCGGIEWEGETIPLFDWATLVDAPPPSADRALVVRGRDNACLALPIADVAKLVNLPSGINLTVPRPTESYPARGLAGVLELADIRAGVLDLDQFPGG